MTIYGTPRGYKPRAVTPPAVRWCPRCHIHLLEHARTLCPTCADEAKNEPVKWVEW